MTGNIADQPVATQRTSLTRRNFLRGSAVVAGGIALYAGEIARHEISVVTHTLGIRNLPDAFHDYRIAQISDIHFDEYTEPSFVARVIEHVNALAPDVVLMTGDFVSNGPRGRDFAYGAILRCLDMLRNIHAPRFACMGNHDSIIGAPVLRPIFASYDTPLLMNAHLALERGGQRLWLCGVGDYLTEIADLDRTLPARPDGPVLLLCHCPDYADAVVGHPRGRLVDLMLCGHSHGGQVRLPLVGALQTPIGAKKYVEGLFHLDLMQLYVNRGIGTVGLPIRLNCPPEITLFTLERA
ncbi:MAG TPA: metallophosphoesterase [Acidobacteriaceae bacterium]|nr:metallophosphoesterase [Acidobacteriaceae bacterium]